MRIEGNCWNDCEEALLLIANRVDWLGGVTGMSREPTRKLRLFAPEDAAMTAMKKRVLFICIHNSARSQIAEAFLKQIAGDRFEVESAGLEPGKLNPLAVKAMREPGIEQTIRVRDDSREDPPLGRRGRGTSDARIFGGTS